MKATACMIGVFVALTFGRSLQAEFSVGTWVQTAPMKGLTMTVEECCNGGRRLTFHVPVGPKSQTITVESRFDGSDAPVLVDSKPNGETMALKRVDARRTTMSSREAEKSTAHRPRWSPRTERRSPSKMSSSIPPMATSLEK